MKNISVLILFFFIRVCSAFAQPVPSPDENFPFLSTFGKQALPDWGDDDFSQTFFFVVPQNEKNPIYIRVFDADVGGKNDEMHSGTFNTKMCYTIYGGKGAHSDPDAQKKDPIGNYKSGIQLFTKTIGQDTSCDDKWISFGPFNPTQGELQPDRGGYVFKIIIEGVDGDDGNLYRMFMSSSSTENKPIEGGNAFAYEYSLRLSSAANSVAHLYPFVDDKVTGVGVNVFDFDDDGVMRVVSVAKKGVGQTSSGNNEWKTTQYTIEKSELNTSLDVQFIKKSASNNNNIVVYITNQYGALMPFFTAPIGGVPNYKYKIGVKTGK